MVQKSNPSDRLETVTAYIAGLTVVVFLVMAIAFFAGLLSGYWLCASAVVTHVICFLLLRGNKLMSSQSKAPQKSRLDVLYELREKKIRCSTEELDAEIIALENEIEPEPKPAFRSIRGGGS